MQIDETKSTHKAEIVPIKLEPHPNPNAKALSIVKVFGYTVVVRTKDWEEYIQTCIPNETPIAVFIQPDSVVPDIKNPPWAYLGAAVKGEDGVTTHFEPLTESERRIKTRRFMGVYSEGILIPVPSKYWDVGLPQHVIDKAEREHGIYCEIANDFLIGEDLASFIGITHYEPKEKNHHKNNSPSQELRGPSIKVPEYDLENWFRYGGEVFHEGMPVVITEKIHGTNARFVYSSRDKEFFVGSHRAWKKQTIELPYTKWYQRALVKLKLKAPRTIKSNSYWAKIADKHPAIQQLCTDYPNYVIYGEIFGDIQDLKYGRKEDEIDFKVFDIYNQNTEEYLSYFSVADLCSRYGLERVPELYYGPYSEKKIRDIVDGETIASKRALEGHLREGIVIQSLEEDGQLAGKYRAKLKAVSSKYLERAKG